MKNHEYFDPDNPGSGSELPPDGDYTGELAENPQQEEYSLPEDVDQIVQEVKQDFHQPDEDALSQPGVPVEEFRDQEYRDAFDENFERAFLAGDDASQDAPPPILPRHRRRRPRRKPIKKKGSGLLGIPHFLTSLILCAIVIAVGVTLGRILWLCADDVLALTKPEQQATVVISDTDTMDEIAEKLASAGLIRYPQLFSLYCDITSAREKISAGEFELNGVYDYNAMVNAISGYSSERTIVEVMIPEGYECRQIFEHLEKNGVCTVEELEDAAMHGELRDCWFLEGIDRSDPYCLEGFLFPDTYEFYTSDDPVRVLNRLLRNFDNRFDEDMIADIEDLNTWLGEKLASHGYDESYIQSQYLSIRDVVTVASMIERETAGTGESATIASVIYNRLCDPDFPYLNIDATIQYALGEHKAELSLDDLQIDSPYNTYTNPGLPAGPISNPGLSSLNAALHPEETDYYFYALDTDGTHYLSETAEEHQAFLDSLAEEGDE